MYTYIILYNIHTHILSYFATYKNLDFYLSDYFIEKVRF